MRSEKSMYNVVATLAPFNSIFFILAGNKDIHKLSEKFKFRLDATTDC